MASFVVFNGQTRYRPGGISRVNADQLNPVTAGENATVALIGEAEGGEPEVALSFSDAAKVKAFFGAGPLVDGANIAFSPSNDPLIPGGASKVICYKTNASTYSTGYLPAMYPVTLRTATATGGSTTTVVDSSAGALSIDNQYVGSWIVLRPGLVNQEARQVTGYAASTGTFTVSPAFNTTAAASNAYVVLANTVDLVATAGAGSSTTTVNLASITGLVTNALAGQQVYVKGTTSATSYYRTIQSNTTSAIVVTPALTFTPSSSTSLIILPQAITLKSKIYGVEANDIRVDLGPAGTGRQVVVTKGSRTETSPILGGMPFLKVLYKGGTIAVQDTVAALSTNSSIILTTAGLTASAHIGTQVRIGSYYTTVTANTTTTLTVSPALPAAPSVGTSVDIFAPAAAFGKVTGSNGVATNFSTTTGVPANDLNISLTSTLSLSQLASQINANTNYSAVIPSGINGDIIFAQEFDFGQATLADIRVSPSLATGGFYQDTAQVINYLNSVSMYVAAVRSTTLTSSGGSLSWDTPDAVALSGAVRGISTNTDFQAGFDAIVTTRVNQVVPLIDRDMINDGFGSTSTITSVANQLKDHVVLCRGSAGSERGGFVGFKGTKSEIVDFIASMNDPDITVCAQNIAALDVSGNLASFSPMMQAVQAAGCRVGAFEIGEPLTNKVVKTASVTQDSSWDPNDLTDSNDLIQAGLLFAFTDDRGATRWVRDLTSWIGDNNAAYSEGSIRDAIRYVVYNLRKTLVDRYTGRKATPTNIRGAKSTAITFLEICRNSNIIVDSVDPATGAPLKAYRNIKIVTSGDVMTFSVCITPVPGINFVINDISLALASQAA
jgi:hypothetical protein